MIFLHPAWLFWAVLAVPLVLLYLREAPPPRRDVATGFLWSKVLEGRAAGGGRRTWRRLMSVLLNLTAVLLVVGAMAEPVMVGQSAAPLWPYPAAAALVLVIVEWCLSQRRWTC